MKDCIHAARLVIDDVESVEPRDFVPAGARTFWPFLLGNSRVPSYQPPGWNAYLLLWWGLVQALLDIQPRKPRETWRELPREMLASLMHKEGAGKDHPSRAFITSQIRPGESVLDVGCGAGAGYESPAVAGLTQNYLGIDSSEPSIEIARELYPAGKFQVGNATALAAQFGSNSFDIVVLRHVLEHLPEFDLAMSEALAVAARRAIFVFYLTPRALPLGVSRLDPGHGRPRFHTNIYSRARSTVSCHNVPCPGSGSTTLGPVAPAGLLTRLTARWLSRRRLANEFCFLDFISGRELSQIPNDKILIR